MQYIAVLSNQLSCFFLRFLNIQSQFPSLSVPVWVLKFFSFSFPSLPSSSARKISSLLTRLVSSFSAFQFPNFLVFRFPVLQLDNLPSQYQSPIIKFRYLLWRFVYHCVCSYKRRYISLHITVKTNRTYILTLQPSAQNHVAATYIQSMQKLFGNQWHPGCLLAM